MAIWATLGLGIVALLGRWVGYSLTLAGIAGFIVSIGIAGDSYIVFYERLKDEVRHGKTPRAAVLPAFRRAWKTIVAANLVTILAAVVLYVLAIGSVRGFALTLGISTGARHVRRLVLQAADGDPAGPEPAAVEPARVRAALGHRGGARRRRPVASGGGEMSLRTAFDTFRGTPRAAPEHHRAQEVVVRASRGC